MGHTQIRHRLDFVNLIRQVRHIRLFFLFSNCCWRCRHICLRVEKLLQCLIQTHCIPDLTRSSTCFLCRRTLFRFLRNLSFLGHCHGRSCVITAFCIRYGFRLFRLCGLIPFSAISIKRFQIRHFFRLSRQLLKSVIIFFLLGRSQGLILHLQFHRLINVLSLTEPQDQVIAFFQAFRCHARFLIQLCKFIRPLFDIFSFLKFFQRLDLLFYRRSLCAQDLVTQDMLIWIFWCDLHEIIVIIYRLVHIPCLNGKCTEPVNDFPASLGAVISDPQDIITLLILFIFLIYVTDIRQHAHIADSFPVDLIGYRCRFTVRAVFHKLKHLFCL